MDRRNWPWRKKSSEKIASAVDQGDTSLAQPSKACEEQDVNRNVPVNLDKIVSPLQLEDKVKNLNEKLSAALAESNAKDALVRQHAKVAEEAVSGWEKAGAEAVSLKQELDVALQLKVAAEDRVSHLDGALKECMRQLRHMREEQEQSIHDAVMKKTRELDRIRIELEEKLAETNQRLLEAVAENSAIHKSLRERITSLNELSESKSHAEAQVNLLQVRLESLEDENAAVKYELRVLDKELEIRNEEREYNRRSADASNKQHLESMKKIAKLETECQRLRVLVRKRLPGPAAVAQMKMEVETLGRETAEWKKKRLHAGKGLILAGSTMGDSLHDNSRENGIKQINALSERLLAMEEENEILKETLTKRISELQASRVMCARTAGKLSQVESHLDALCRGQGLGRIGSMAIDGHVEMSKGVRMSYEPSLASISVDGGNEDEVSCAESWASALISELAQFKKVKPGIPTNKVLESTELDLMDDFVEMERLATVSSEEAAVSTLPTEIEEKTNEPRELKTEKNSNAFPMMEESADNHTSIEQHLSSFQSRTLDGSVNTSNGVSGSDKEGSIEISYRVISESFPDRDQDELLSACQVCGGEAKGDIEEALSILLDQKNLNACERKGECLTEQHNIEESYHEKSILERLKLTFPNLAEGILNEILESVNFNYSEATNVLLEAGMRSGHVENVDRSSLPRQVLESLFNMSGSSEQTSSDMDWVKAVKNKKKSKQKPVNTSLGNLSEPAGALCADGEEDEYQQLRKTATQHWSTMKSYYQEAAAAYSRGERARAGYLSEQGQFYKQIAREADEKASQRIFEFKNRDMRNDITIDLHSQHVTDAVRLLKLHIKSLACISSIHYLKVITGCGSHGTGRGRIKRAVTQFLEKEGINWTEENTGVVVIKMTDVDPHNLSFANADSDA